MTTLPRWRYELEDHRGRFFLADRPLPIDETDHEASALLGQFDGRRALGPHDLDRFGDDEDGQRLHAAYLDGWMTGMESREQDRIAGRLGEG